MRLSVTQKDALFLLYAIEARQALATPVPATDLLLMINQQRTTPVFASNFRASCHTLHKHGLLLKYRSPSLMLAFQLSPQGKDVARNVYRTRLDESASSEGEKTGV